MVNKMEMMPLLICRGERKGAGRFPREKAGEEAPPDVPGSEEGDHEEGGGD
jgi:hypothetical protein